jgi:hypothetical protein
VLESRRVAQGALLVLPAAMVGYLAFNSGGFYPGPTAYVAAVLCIALLLRVTLAENPFQGVQWRLVIPATALGLFALETLLSQAWSHAPGVALTEFDLPLVYLAAMVLFGSLARSSTRLGWTLRALGAAIVTVCTCALITRLLPHVWPITPELADNRLSFPLTYWNALGLFAAFGAVLCVHFTSDIAESRVVRVLAAAALPVQACTLYFTFSRGGIVIALLAVGLYVLLGRPRGLLSAAIAGAPTTAIALVVAYHANHLATTNPTTTGAVMQGHHVAAVLGGCIAGAALLRGLLLPLDARLLRISIAAEVRRRAAWIVWASAGVALVVLVVVFHSAIAHQYHRFLNPAPPGSAADLRTRLTDPGNNGRIDMWRVAWHGFESAPLLGHGAGTFAETWAQHRPTGDFVVDAHSLYLEVLDELGIVGLLLLLTAIVIPLVVAARRTRGPSRPLYAAILAVMLAWALHAAIDWDWEMPVVSVIFFALAGAVTARHLIAATESSKVRALLPSAQGRVVLGLGCVLLAVAPTYVWLAERKLNQATAAYNAGNCRVATSAALSSISIVGTQAPPYEIVSYCDVRRDMPNMALANIGKAVSLDPRNYNYAVDLAVIRAAAGLDPMAAARRALALNPRDPVAQQVWQSLRADTPQEWQSDGKQFVSEFTSL